LREKEKGILSELSHPLAPSPFKERGERGRGVVTLQGESLRVNPS